jgi:hypothetical protein
MADTVVRRRDECQDGVRWPAEGRAPELSALPLLAESAHFRSVVIDDGRQACARSDPVRTATKTALTEDADACLISPCYDPHHARSGYHSQTFVHRLEIRPAHLWFVHGTGNVSITTNEERLLSIMVHKTKSCFQQVNLFPSLDMMQMNC